MKSSGPQNRESKLLLAPPRVELELGETPLSPGVVRVPPDVPSPMPIEVVPRLDRPRLDVPRLDRPRLDVPRLDRPKLEPRLGLPKLDPRLDLPRLEPRLDLPRLEVPRPMPGDVPIPNRWPELMPRPVSDREPRLEVPSLDVVPMPSVDRDPIPKLPGVPMPGVPMPGRVRSTPPIAARVPVVGPASEPPKLDWA